MGNITQESRLDFW